MKDVDGSTKINCFERGQEDSLNEVFLSRGLKYFTCGWAIDASLQWVNLYHKKGMRCALPQNCASKGANMTSGIRYEKKSFYMIFFLVFGM